MCRRAPSGEPIRSRRRKCRRGSGRRRSRRVAPISRRGRRGATRISPAPITTATRAAFRSSAPRSSPAAVSRISRRAELEKLTKQRQQQTIERAPGLSEFPGATSPMHWFENYFAANSRAWLVSDPPDGKVPPVTDEGRKRAADRAAARKGRGPADSWEDRSLYDRCITRGVPGSMMPAIYGNSYQIQQGPGLRHDHLRDGARHARHPGGQPAAHLVEDPPVSRRCARPLGRQHARRRDDQLQRQGAVSRIERPAAHRRTLHADRPGHARMGDHL